MSRYSLDNIWICLIQLPMFIMDVNMEALLVIRLGWQKVPYHSFQHSFQPNINIPSQNYWLHLPPALPLLAISECQRRMWGRERNFEEGG